MRQNLFDSDVVAVNLAARVQFRGDVRSILKDYVQRNMCRTDHRAVKNIELSPVQEPSIVNSQETLRRPIAVEDVRSVPGICTEAARRIPIEVFRHRFILDHHLCITNRYSPLSA